jgi:hypothetical protein
MIVLATLTHVLVYLPISKDTTQVKIVWCTENEERDRDVLEREKSVYCKERTNDNYLNIKIEFIIKRKWRYNK